MTHLYFIQKSNFLLKSIIILLLCSIFSCNPQSTVGDLEKEVERRYLEVADSKEVSKWIDEQLKTAEQGKNPKDIINGYKAKAKYYQLIQNYDSAFIWHKKALEKAQKYQLNALLPKIYERLAYNQYMLYNKPLCIEYAKLSLETAKSTKDTVQMGFSHIWLYMASAKEESMNHLRQAEEFACYSQNKQLKAYVYNELGVVAWGNGNQKESFNYFQEVLKLAEEINDRDYILLSYHNISVTSDYFGKYHDAFKYYRQGISLATKYKNKLFLARFYQKVAYNLCHYHYHQLAEAEEYIAKAEEAYQGFYDPRLAGNIPAVKGAILYKQKKTPEALSSLHQAFANANKADAKVESGRICSDISLIYLAENNNDSAMYYIDKAIANYQDREQMVGLQKAQLIQAKIYLNKNDYQSAEKLALAVLKKVDGNNKENYLHLELGYEILHTIYSRQGNYKAALGYYTQMNAIKDTIFSKDRAREIGKMQAEAELEKEITASQYKIQKLNKDITIKNQRKNLILAILAFISTISIFMFYIIISYKANNRKLKMLNIQVIRTNENLERVVEERTKELKESHEKTIKVVQANSHDIRNHVARILGLVILYKNNLAEKKFIIENIERSATALDTSVCEINLKLHQKRTNKS